MGSLFCRYLGFTHQSYMTMYYNFLNVPLAVYQKYHEIKMMDSPPYSPPLTVLIPAYNEEKVGNEKIDLGAVIVDVCFAQCTEQGSLHANENISEVFEKSRVLDVFKIQFDLMRENFLDVVLLGIDPLWIKLFFITPKNCAGTNQAGLNRENSLCLFRV